jgi:hypothetical protein
METGFCTLDLDSSAQLSQTDDYAERWGKYSANQGHTDECSRTTLIYRYVHMQLVILYHCLIGGNEQLL